MREECLARCTDGREQQKPEVVLDDGCSSLFRWNSDVICVLDRLFSTGYSEGGDRFRVYQTQKQLSLSFGCTRSNKWLWGNLVDFFASILVLLLKRLFFCLKKGTEVVPVRVFFKFSSYFASCIFAVRTHPVWKYTFCIVILPVRAPLFPPQFLIFWCCRSNAILRVCYICIIDDCWMLQSNTIVKSVLLRQSSRKFPFFQIWRALFCSSRMPKW